MANRTCEMCGKRKHDVQTSKVYGMTLCGICWFDSLVNLDEVDEFTNNHNDVFELSN